MRVFSYNNEIKNLTIQFMDTLNDIVCKRITPTDTQINKVHCVAGNAHRTYKFLAQPALTSPIVPIISTRLTNIQRDAQRVSGLNDYLMDIPDPHIVTDSQWLEYVNKIQGNPINFTFAVDIFTVYQEDLDQIITNLTALCNPSIYIVLPHPKIPVRKLTTGELYQPKLKVKCVWDGQMDLTFPFEATAEEHPFRYVASTNFKVEGWVFPGDKPVSPVTKGIINKINFYPEIYDLPDSDGMYMLSNWYSVPTNMPFENYQQNIILGKIKRPFFDELSISGQQYIHNAPTGYFSDISAMVSGTYINQQIPVSGNPCYLVTEHEDILLFSTANVLNEYGEVVDVKDVIKQFEETGRVI